MAQHTISGLDSYFGAIVLDEGYVKGAGSMLHREDLIEAKFPVGVRFMSRSNVRQLMRTVRARVGQCNLSLFDMFNDLRTTYFKYFATMNEPMMPPEKVAVVVRELNRRLVEKLVKSRTLYTAARRAFLQAIGGMNPIERRPIYTRTKDTSLYAHAPNLAPCFTHPQDCVFGDAKERAPGFAPREYPPAGGTQLFQARPNFKGKRRGRML